MCVCEAHRLKAPHTAGSYAVTTGDLRIAWLGTLRTNWRGEGGGGGGRGEGEGEGGENYNYV